MCMLSSAELALSAPATEHAPSSLMEFPERRRQTIRHVALADARATQTAHFLRVPHKSMLCSVEFNLSARATARAPSTPIQLSDCRQRSTHSRVYASRSKYAYGHAAHAPHTTCVLLKSTLCSVKFTMSAFASARTPSTPMEQA